MSKTVSAALLAAIQSSVADFATLVTIRQQDGRILRLTTNDQPVTFEGEVYSSSLRFNLTASTHASDFSVDNVDMVFATDEDSILLEDISRGIMDGAEVTIARISRENPSAGSMILNRGWVGTRKINTLRVVTLTIVGLLKVLDFEVGRVYSATCDADFGDKRCKFAVRPSQAYSPRNRYHQGQWFYVYDTAEMSAATLTNATFEVDAPRGLGDSIAGWTKSANAAFVVLPSSPADGTYALYGGANADPRAEQRVTQTINLLTSLPFSAFDVDSGHVHIHSSVAARQVDETTLVRYFVEVLDAEQNVIDFMDTRYVALDTTGVWRDLFCTGALLTGARYLRINLMMYKTSGGKFNAGFDDLRVYGWDRTVTTPDAGLVHKVTRLSKFPTASSYAIDNFSFEDDEVVASDTPDDIAGWTKTTGSFFGVDDNKFSLFSQDDDNYLYAGDDLSGLQKTYTIVSPAYALADAGLDSDKIISGVYAHRIAVLAGFGDTGVSTAHLDVEYLDSVSSVVGTFSAETTGTAGQWRTLVVAGGIPSSAVTFRVSLSAESGPLTSAANVAFDRVTVHFVDTQVPARNDLIFGQGQTGFKFDQTAAGVKNVSGNLVTRSRTKRVYQDAVAAAIGDRSFQTTFMVGPPGSYDTGLIRWITGANAGHRNIIRAWFSDDQTATLYYVPLFPIESGDVFEYEVVCHRRFMEDCVIKFDNGVNFRGFPYLPGTTRFGVTA